jgi:hypothetical protein
MCSTPNITCASLNIPTTAPNPRHRATALPWVFPLWFHLHRLRALGRKPRNPVCLLRVATDSPKRCHWIRHCSRLFCVAIIAAVKQPWVSIREQSLASKVWAERKFAGLALRRLQFCQAQGHHRHRVLALSRYLRLDEKDSGLMLS